MTMTHLNLIQIELNLNLQFHYNVFVASWWWFVIRYECLWINFYCSSHYWCHFKLQFNGIIIILLISDSITIKNGNQQHNQSSPQPIIDKKKESKRYTRLLQLFLWGQSVFGMLTIVMLLQHVVMIDRCLANWASHLESLLLCVQLRTWLHSFLLGGCIFLLCLDFLVSTSHLCILYLL